MVNGRMLFTLLCASHIVSCAPIASDSHSDVADLIRASDINSGLAKRALPFLYDSAAELRNLFQAAAIGSGFDKRSEHRDESDDADEHFQALLRAANMAD